MTTNTSPTQLAPNSKDVVLPQRPFIILDLVVLKKLTDAVDVRRFMPPAT